MTENIELDLYSPDLFPFENLVRKSAGIREGEKQIRIGIMGGTFDPVHLGHLACAEMARDACGLAGVIFIPAGNPSFKQGMRIASAADRIKMCELAVADNSFFSVSSLETVREGITYTVDTLEIMRAYYPENIIFSFIIGTDSLLTLKKWKNVERLAQLAEFICVARPGYVEDAQQLEQLKCMGLRIRTVQAPLLDISSSEIKRRIVSHETIRYLAPLSVCKYIESHGLYQEESEVVSDGQ